MWAANFLFWQTWIGRVKALHTNKLRTVRIRADARIVYIQRD